MEDRTTDPGARSAAWTRRGLGAVLAASAGGLALAGHGAWGGVLLSFAGLCFSPEIGALCARWLPGPGLSAEDPGAGPALKDQARAVRVAGDLDEAARLLARAAEEDAQDQAVRLDLARLYQEEIRDPDAACYWFGKVVEYGRGSEMEAEAFGRWIGLLIDRGEAEGARRLHQAMAHDFADHPRTRAAGERLRDMGTPTGPPSGAAR